MTISTAALIASENGANFTSAYYTQLPTVTAVGHSICMSGAMRAVSGIVENNWIDGEEDKIVTRVCDGRRQIVSSWLTIEPYGNWVPAESRDVERKLFYADLTVILELIRNEYGVASRDPDS